MNARFLFLLVSLLCRQTVLAQYPVWGHEYPKEIEGQQQLRAKCNVARRTIVTVPATQKAKGVCYYDNKGRDTLLVQNGEVVQRNFFNDTFLIKTNHNNSCTNPVQNTLYNDRGDIISINDGGTMIRADYIYDSINRISLRTIHYWNKDCLNTFHYDTIGRLVAIQGGCDVLSCDSTGVLFEYDSNGRIALIYAARDTASIHVPLTKSNYKSNYTDSVQFNYYPSGQTKKVSYYTGKPELREGKYFREYFMYTYRYNRLGLVKYMAIETNRYVTNNKVEIYYTYTYRKQIPQ
jgi:hypothetical protein